MPTTFTAPQDEALNEEVSRFIKIPEGGVTSLTEEQLDQFDAGQFPRPLAILADMTDEDAGFNPANIQTTILFQRVDASAAALLEDVCAIDGETLFDFRRIVEPPAGISGRAARKWGIDHWGVDHNAGGAELVDHLGFHGVSFFTEDFPAAVLKALAAKHPTVSWTVYACAWQLGWCASGAAADGEFKVRERKISSRKDEDDDFMQTRHMAFGQLPEKEAPEVLLRLVEKTRAIVLGAQASDNKSRD